MSDTLLRMISKDCKIRAFATDTSELVETARVIHRLSPIATAALGRTLTAGAMMGVMLKNPTDKLTIQIKGNGSLGGIIVSANHLARVKGYVYNPEVYLEPNKHGKLDVGGAVGNEGYLNVIKDMGMKEPYIGFVPLVSGEIGEDISYYFLKSEQIPSIVALGVLVDKTGEVLASGGFIVQVMPGAGDYVLNELEKNLENLSSLTTYLSNGKTIKEILEIVTGKIEMQEVDTIKPEFLCDCSKDRMERALISLGKQELNSIIENQGHIEIECHFCLKKYLFNKEQVDSMMK